jgi:5-methyltetrahydropteroyltriglutamate--homocysteine methyltransferase
MTKILTTHVGSLIRPDVLIPYLEKIIDREPYDAAGFDAALTPAVGDIVRRQADIGLDLIDDGEFSKVSWITYFYDRVSGIEERAIDLAGMNQLPDDLDREAFAEYYEGHDTVQAIEVGKRSDLIQHGEHAGGTASTGKGIQWVCTGPISYDGASVQRDIDNLKAALDTVDVTDGFLPVVAPASAYWLENEYYESDEAFVWALADALSVEYRQIVDSGLMLQVDDAVIWHQLGTMRLKGGSTADFLAWARTRIEATNHALKGIPPERVRYHVCCGSWHGAHTTDPELSEVIELVLDVNAGAYLFEQGNPAHEHEWTMWRDIDLPDDKILVPGVVTHHTHVVEHPELIAQRLVRLAEIVGPERVQAGTDCGFAQSALTRRVPEWTQWAKLEALVEGARIASERLSGVRAAA